MEVIKRDGTKVPFQKEKIAIAIEKAMNSASGIYQAGVADKIASEIEEYARGLGHSMTIYSIEDQVYYKLLDNNNPATARAYENYKAMQSFKRHINTTDDDILGLIRQTNVAVMDENSTKIPTWFPRSATSLPGKSPRILPAES